MLQEHARVVRFIQAAAEVKGRKKLQKMVFIAKKLDFPFQAKYQFHMYGPYSEELTIRVQELCSMGFLRESVEDRGNYIQYGYAATEEGVRFAADHPADRGLAPCVSAMNGKSARFLELTSTLLYFDALSREEQITKVHAVKGKLNFTDAEFQEAFAFIEQLQHLRSAL